MKQESSHRPGMASAGRQTLVARGLAWGSAFALMLGGCSQKPSAPGLLAKVGDREIRLEDFQRELEFRLKSQRPPADRQALLDEMIARETQVQRAKAAGLEQDPEVQRNYASLLVTRLRDKELRPRLESTSVATNEIQAEYQKNLSHYTRPAKAQLAIIQVKTPPKMTEDKLAEARTRIEDARRQALALPASARGFGPVALTCSEDQSTRYKGGDAGWFDEGQSAYRFPTEVIAAGFALKTNREVSEVLRTADGYYLVTRLDTRPRSFSPLTQVENSLSRRLLAEKRQQAEQSFLLEVRQSTPVKVFPETLRTVDFPTTAVVQAQESAPPDLPR